MVCPELPPLTPELPSLLAGQTAPRWVRDLHPHLVLDVLALARRLDLDKRTSICAPADLSALLADLDPLAGKPWPVALIEAE